MQCSCQECIRFCFRHNNFFRLNWIYFIFVCFQTAQPISRDTFNLTSAYPHAFWVIVKKTAAGFFFFFLLRTSCLPALGPPQRKHRQIKGISNTGREYIFSVLNFCNCHSDFTQTGLKEMILWFPFFHHCRPKSRHFWTVCCSDFTQTEHFHSMCFYFNSGCPYIALDGSSELILVIHLQNM